MASIQEGLFLWESFLHYSTLMQFENLHHFSNSRYNFWFNMILHRQYSIIFSLTRLAKDDLWPILSRVGRLAESDVTVTPSFTCMDWLYWWHNP